MTKFTPNPTYQGSRTSAKTPLCLLCLKDCGTIQSKDIKITDLLKSCPY
jgi:hypothetical protein